ncbi:MAG: helix-turn-helix transcriptional regulator [Bacteroidales bacterium]|jgi:transcriptional regulator with XRE-family HTH domain|nr:helix-turn-helix transcriptional regulator [Bacteroidales bacterium]
MLKDRIAHIMRSKNLTATQLADDLQVQRSGISHLLSGRNKPSLDFIMKLKETYPEYNLDWLVLGTGPITVSSSQRAAQRPQQALFEEKIEEKGDSAVENIEEEDLSITAKQEESTKKAPTYEGALLNSLNAGIEKVILIYEDQSFEVLHPKKPDVSV